MSMSLLRQLLAYYANRVLPCQCLCCGSVSGKTLLCLACLQDLPWLETVCQQCCLPLVNHQGALLCGECLNDPPPFDEVIALFNYQSPINHLIHQLKFSRQLSIARFMGELLSKAVALPKAQPDIIIPVPLHPKRLRQRGFNQALEVARVISKSLQIPLMTKAVIRSKYTVEQAGLPAEQRAANLAQAFSLQQPLHASSVAIVDDVMTTGHTVKALACLLRQQGVKRIAVWCCARTGFDE